MKIITSDSERYRRKDGKFYIVYRVDNIDNGNFYIGSCRTTNLEDSYYGTPGQSNEYYNVLQECKQSGNFDNLIFTILKFSTKQNLYKDEYRIIDEYKNNKNLYNVNKGENLNINHFQYEPGDPNNPFINQKERLSAINTKKNKEWSGIYVFCHPVYGIFKCTITELIDNFKDKNIIIDRGMMNLIGRLGHLRNGFLHKGKIKHIQPDNKYYDWTCLEVIKKPTWTKY